MREPLGSFRPCWGHAGSKPSGPSGPSCEFEVKYVTSFRCIDVEMYPYKVGTYLQTYSMYVRSFRCLLSSRDALLSLFRLTPLGVGGHLGPFAGLLGCNLVSRNL